MTVTPPIGGIAPEIRRAQENHNRTASVIAAKLPGTASLPTDSIVSTAPAYSASMPLSLAITQTERQNREAAQSTLSDDDFLSLERTPTAQEQVQAQAKASAAAQTNRLPPSMLELLVE